jgi:hypothetical protein
VSLATAIDAIRLVVLECLFDAVTRLAFALDVVWVVHHAGPALVRATRGISCGHHVLAWFVVIDMTVRVGPARRVGGNAVERPVSADGVDNLLPRSGLQCLGIGGSECSNGRGDVGVVTSQEGCVIRARMMVCGAGDVIERVDGVGADLVLGT